MLLSIIIPVYNAEKYIKECIESIYNNNINDNAQNKNWDKFEVITVNDGSKDKSLSILNSMKEIYPTLKVIDKKNGGVSSARNKGIDVASGKYILFVDIDDIIEDSAIDTIIDTIQSQESDLYIGNYSEVSEDNQILRDIDVADEINSSIEGMHHALLFGYAMNACWGKIYKRENIEKWGLRFDTSIKMGEDLLFVAQYCKKTTHVLSIKKTIYRYRQLESGAVLTNRSKLDKANIDDLVRTIKCKKEYALSINMSNEEQELLMIELSSVLSGVINLTLKANWSLREKKEKLNNLISQEIIYEVMDKVSVNKHANGKRRVMCMMIKNAFLRNIYVTIKHILA